MFPVRSSTLITHIVAWLIFLSLPVLFVNAGAGSAGLMEILSSPYSWLFFVTYILIFYFNTWVLLPRLYQHKRYFLYILSVLIMLAGIWMLKPFDKLINRHREQVTFRHERPMRPPGSFGIPPSGKPPRFGEGRPRNGMVRVDVVSIFLYLMLLALSLAVHNRQQLRLTEEKVLRAEADKANAELSFLKAQIHPHFLFNTLNNIYTLAVSKSEHTAESILKLSNIMRYVTDEVMEEFVPLENEIAFIRDYIDLQRLRLGGKTAVNFEVTGNIAGKKIAPLILMTFVENLFKYGVSMHDPSGITIAIEATAEAIGFNCTNKLYDTRRTSDSTGIGISNTKKRLEHLYPGKHELTITTENGMFSVGLVLFT